MKKTNTDTRSTPQRLMLFGLMALVMFGAGRTVRATLITNAVIDVTDYSSSYINGSDQRVTRNTLDGILTPPAQTNWETANAEANNPSITYFLNNLYTLNSITIYNGTDGGSSRAFSNTLIEVSSDWGKTWATQSIQNLTSTAYPTTNPGQAVSNTPVNATQVRITQLSANKINVGLAEVQFDASRNLTKSSLITGVTATASSYYGGRVPNNCCDGLNKFTTDAELQWLSSAEPLPWITFNLGSIKTVNHLTIYNQNTPGYIRDVATFVISNSLDGVTYTPVTNPLDGTTTFSIKTSRGTDASGNAVYLGNIQAKYLKLKTLTKYGADNYTGLSEVEFWIAPRRGSMVTIQ
ncbi:MAG: discoidin domain-containing protein [bacterium]